MDRVYIRVLSSYPDRWRRVARSIGSIFNVGGVLAEGDGHSLLHLAAVTAAAAVIGDVIRLFNDHSGVPALWTPGGGCRLSARPCVGQSGVGAVRGRAKGRGRVREPACARACPRVCLDFGRMPHANPTRDNARRASHAAMHPCLQQNHPASAPRPVSSPRMSRTRAPIRAQCGYTMTVSSYSYAMTAFSRFPLT